MRALVTALNAIAAVVMLAIATVIGGAIWLVWSVVNEPIPPRVPDGCSSASWTGDPALLEAQPFEEEQEGLRYGALRGRITLWASVTEYAIIHSRRLVTTHRSNVPIEHLAPGTIVPCSVAVEPMAPYMFESTPYGVFVAQDKLVILTLPSRRVVMLRQLPSEALAIVRREP